MHNFIEQDLQVKNTCQRQIANFTAKSVKIMLIERTSREVIIRLPASVDTTGLQRLVDYLSYKEATANSKATQEQVDKLASEVKKGLWKKNRKRFIK